MVRIGDVMQHIIGITEVKPKSSTYQCKIAEYSLDDIGDNTRCFRTLIRRDEE